MSVFFVVLFRERHISAIEMIGTQETHLRKYAELKSAPRSYLNPETTDTREVPITTEIHAGTSGLQADMAMGGAKGKRSHLVGLEEAKKAISKFQSRTGSGIERKESCRHRNWQDFATLTVKAERSPVV